MSDSKELTSYKTSGLSPFGGNQISQSAYFRAERLIMAAHLVTNFIPEHDPVRNRIREVSILVLESTLDLREGLRTAGPERVNDIIASLLELSTLFDVANASGYLSQMNVSVLKRACSNLGLFLRKSEDTPQSESLVLGESYFTEDEREVRGVHGKTLKDKKYIGQKQKFLSGSDVKKRTELSQKKNDRQEAVLKVVQEKRRVSIKDVADQVPGYSEKTIQRELLALAAKGVVRKEGERRWSTYVLVSQ